MKQNQCDCLARSTTCTKRASLGPALLALLPLRRLPQLFGSAQYFFVSTKSLSCFCRRWTSDRRWDKRKHKHTRSDNVTVLVAVSTVAVVARQLIRGNAIAHVVFVPWCDIKNPARQAGVCLVNNCHKARLGRAAPATARRRWDRAPER